MKVNGFCFIFTLKTILLVALKKLAQYAIVQWNTKRWMSKCWVFQRTPVESHEDFISKYKLPFTLLSDTTKKVIKMYGADGGITTKRISYLIDPDGMIAKAYSKVDPEKHAEEVLADVETLR
jgi:peroxiredoxin